MAKDKRISKLLNGKTVLRGKISHPIILGQVIEFLNFSPKALFSEQSLDVIWFRLSKIENVITQILSDKDYKKETFKKAVNSLYLDDTKSKENQEVISAFMESIEKSTADIKEQIIRELIDIKEKFNIFVASDLSKPEKMKIIKDVIEVYYEFITEQLKKERQIETPLGKYAVKVHQRFLTKGVSFDVNAELKEFLLKNSDKNSEEIEKQKEAMENNITKDKKYLLRLNKDKKEV